MESYRRLTESIEARHNVPLGPKRILVEASLIEAVHVELLIAQLGTADPVAAAQGIVYGKKRPASVWVKE
jgi:hypothetical protein